MKLFINCSSALSQTWRGQLFGTSQKVKRVALQAGVTAFEKVKILRA